MPEFDVIRQEVEVANGTAQLVEAQGDYRIAKQELVELLGMISRRTSPITFR